MTLFPGCRRLWKKWDAWLLAEGPPHCLGIMRIGFGLSVLAEGLTYLPFLRTIASNQGVTLPLLPYPWAAAPSPTMVYVLAAVFLAAAIGFTLGAYYRLSAATLLLMCLTFWHLFLYLFGTSFHRLFLFTLLILLCSNAHETLSVDAWRKRGSWVNWVPVSLLPQRLIALQITFTYVGVAALKLVFKAWQGGEVFSYSLAGMWATPPAFWIIRLNLPMEFYDAVTKGVTLFEFALIWALWTKRWRWVGVAMGIAFHGGIAILMSIWWFLALIPLYAAFWEPQKTLIGTFRQR